MRHFIARALMAPILAVLALCLPASGRHRRLGPAPHRRPPAPSSPEPPTTRRYREEIAKAPRSPYAEASAVGAPLDGEEVALIRPYLLRDPGQGDAGQGDAGQRDPRQREEEQRLQAQRRAALLLALDGIDVVPPTIHGVPVPIAMAAAG
ncbi:hypothetical protein [Allostreptomyces psammosilenae]|uniref:Uncharacterized protein n=1 Tax=Allostreptomyces psammosilenae TaxID=1892865 RepID=A0A852ZS57_9ACTN|nr:hypothetical protein [Allostreptomyces psammosilenae]NYI05213.1 hypothetical protein [Allostreptomyces psammosilenae]